ncbi:MBG domain-containing protein [Pyruvatibacter mobilis]|uniref:MBG domain-containing protein n=1 Tax=Pyruvatibacter mobilis TaxID=1712261 RepID=UPI003D0F47F6
MSRAFKTYLLGCSCLSAIAVATGATPATAQQAVLPEGGQFTAGAGQVSQSGNAMLITQTTDRAVMSWQDFSISAQGQVHFSNGSGATLNRVTGQHVSQIDGALSATGSLYLLNPNGVIVGSGGTIATGGDFVASTLDADIDTFMSDGTLDLEGASQASVVNLGRIAASGGDILLAAHHVRNEGQVSAGGEAALVAGHSVTLRDTGGDARIKVRTGLSGNVTNAGLVEGARATLEAAGGNIYALAGNTDGVARGHVVARDGGRIRLAAADAVEITGTLTADNASAQRAGRGGRIDVTGDTVSLGSTARLSANGRADGGDIHVGGGWQGSDPELRNASVTAIAAGAELTADGETGDGGTVVAWSDGVTVFEGGISARGAQHGDGGRGAGGKVEVSGKQHLAFRGDVDTGGGTLLLDPTDIEIVDSITGTQISAVDAGGDKLMVQALAQDSSQVLASDLEALLQGNNVVITTQNANGNGNGDIMVSAAIEKTGGVGGTALTMSAERNITVNARIGSDDAARPLSVGLSAANDVTVNAAVETRGGMFSAAAGNNVVVGATGNISTEGGAIQISADTDGNANGWGDGTGLFRVVNGGLVSSGGGDIRVESLGTDILGPSLTSVVVDGGAGNVYFDRRGAYTTSHRIHMSKRGSIGIQNGNYYAWYDDFSKVRAGTLHINDARRVQYLTAYDPYNNMDWAANVTGTARIAGSDGIQIYGGLNNLSADVFLDHDGSRSTGINALSLGSSPILIRQNLTIRSPGLRMNGAGMYIEAANGNITVKSDDFFNQAPRMFRAPNGYIAFEGFSPGAYTAPRDYDWYGTPYYGWWSSASAPLVYVGGTDTTTLNIGNAPQSYGGGSQAAFNTLAAQRFGGMTGQVIFRAQDAININGGMDIANASATFNPDVDGNGSGTINVNTAEGVFAGGNLALQGATQSAGTIHFGAGGNLDVLGALQSSGIITLEADRDGNGSGTVTTSSATSIQTNGADVVIAGDRYTNQAASNVIDLGGGRFLIYTATPLNDTLNGITGQRRYNKTYAGTPPGGVAEAGNLFFHTLAPTLTVKAEDASRAYGQANGSFTFAAVDPADIVAGDSLADILAGAVITTTADAPSGVGNYVLTGDITGLTSKMGYGLTVQNGTLAVTPAQLTITANAASKAYGGADPALTYTHAGFVNGDTAALFTGRLVRQAGETVAGGPYQIGQGTLAAGGNYAIAYTPAAFTIDPVALIVTADDAARMEGEPNPTFTASYQGFVNGEGPAALTGGIVFNTVAGPASPAGRYVVTPGGVSSTNYVITFVDGELVVRPAPAQVPGGSGPGTAGPQTPEDIAGQLREQNDGEAMQVIDELSLPPSLQQQGPGAGDQGTGTQEPPAGASGAGQQGGGTTPLTTQTVGSTTETVVVEYTVFGRKVSIRLPATFVRMMREAFASGTGVGGA